ncbi:IPT/TIG domain protein (macronuclear) [Tetrahymena thermophila SB210]|uniref:IPT/TIG domain protein n=1 Tax=Tetrahymena thermophila (strain SB210) TaxID=312017 RepID=Q22PA4_TETTS|nr:IPT/TIG domain protein [Tetrahymena thermophila SB210]EAR87205.2 IPT/TIG domain protein [Tetrahymena thermophila SB210]|eukprot:XP_001007450.2 IPT/TIG domain protein [Tetrahymena thermophila SB210]
MRARISAWLLFFSLLVTSQAVEIGAAQNSVRILSVSTILDTDNAQRQGSLNGGTRVYIKMVGQDSTMASNNNVLIGPYPCIIPDMGVNEVFVSCVTTAAYDSTQQWNLPVVVNVVNRSASQCAQNDASLCTFSYSGSFTPMVDIIFPRAVLPKFDFEWWGTFRISNTKQITKMLVGQLLCDRFNLGLNEDTPYNGNSYSPLSCQVDYSHPAGFYLSQFISVPGQASNQSHLTTIRSTTLDSPYDIQIVSQQPSQGVQQNITSQGGYLTIQASNIPTNTQNVTVTWNNANCQITDQQISSGYFTCVLPSGLSNPTIDQTLRYESGSGVHLQAYNTSSWDLNGLINQYKTNLSQLTLANESIIPSTEYYYDLDPNMDNLQRQFIVLQGYFNPPRDGNYYFHTSSSYQAQVLFQFSGDSTIESTMTTINTITYGTNLRDPYSQNYDLQQSTSDSISLKKGQSYFFKIYALASSASSFYHSTGVRIPSGNTNNYINTVSQLSRFRIDYQFTKEVVSITFKDRTTATKTTFGMNFIYPYGAQISKQAQQWVITSQQYNRDTPCSTIIWHFNVYSGANSTCTQTDVTDSNNNKIGTTWQLTFQYHRQYDVQPTFVFNKTTTDSPVYNVITPVGPPLSGTFRLKINGNYVQINKSPDIPYNIYEWQLCSGIQQILQTSNIACSRNINFVDGSQWYFDFYGITSKILVEAESQLVGQSGAINLYVDTLRQASNSYLYYAAIENELITQRSAQPYAAIKVNGVLTLASLTNQQLIVNVLSDSQAISYTKFDDDNASSTLTISEIQANGFNPIISNFTIYYNGIKCIITTPLSSTFSGTLKATYLSKVAGIYKPVIFYQSNGIALSSQVSAVTQNPIVTQLSSTTIYTYGGTTLTLTGKYFPNSIDNNLKVTFGQISASIQSATNTQIVVLSPSGLSEGTISVIVTYNGLSSNSVSVTVSNNNAITLTNIDKKLASPVDKTLITVQGTNFGNDSSKLQAFLDAVDSNGNLVTYGKYQVNVVTATDTKIQILLGGGLPGKYQLRVVQVGFGSNIPTDGVVNLIEYNILINSFSLNKVSAYGGAQLIINGVNFSSSLTDNQVLVVYSKTDSEICILQAASSTSITCTLPNMYQHLPLGTTSESFEIEVWGKLIVKAIVDPSSSSFTPSITFDSSLGIQVGTVNNQWQRFNSQYSINGTNIPTDAKTFSVIIIGYENIPITINSSNSTLVTYTTPNLPSGDYNIVLRTVVGDSSYLKITIQEYTYPLASSQLYTISSQGAEISLVMSGNIPGQNPIFKFNGLQATLLQYNNSTGQVTIRLPSSPVGSNYQLLSVRSPLVPLTGKGNLPWVTHQTAFTVIAPNWSVSQVQVNGNILSITGNGISALKQAYLQQSTNNNQQIVSTSITSQTNTGATITFANAPAGTYQLYLLDSSNNYPSFSNNSNQVQISLQNLSSSQTTSSYAGGQTLTINGSGFNTNNISQNLVTICGNQATVQSASSSSLVITTPPAYSVQALSNYKFPSDQVNPLAGFTTFGNDPNGNSQYLADGDLLFYYSNSQGGSCFCGLNFGTTYVVLSKFQLYPRSQGVTDASLFFGTVFQGSVDGTNWVTLLTIGTDFHLGKNMYLIDTLVSNVQQTQKKNLQGAYTQFRLFDQSGLSNCQMVEIQLFGWKRSAVVESGTTLACPVSVSVNGSPIFSLANNVIYDQQITYIVQSITPSYGSISGGTLVTISLDRAPDSSAKISVFIDGIICSDPKISQSSISCQTGPKSSSANSSLVVQINSYLAVNNGIIFYYGNLWSSASTWGNDFAPIAGDIVYVNNGKSLIVDVPYVGILNTIVIQNANLIFANNMNIHLETNSILVQSGNVVIGTQSSPVTGNVRITLYGQQSDKQFPTVGNKGLSIYNGSIDIQGQTRAVTWTELSATANVGETSIQVFMNDPAFDWQIGEEIVIASTDYVDGHSERRIITNISKNADGKTVTISFVQPLLVQHVSVTGESYKSGQFLVNMRAEVGLLTRNVVFEGDQSSIATRYGAHLMLHGSQTSARIRYAEFRYTGQPAIIGRYPIHFHMVGDVSGSVVEGNAIHDSFARAVTIHATHYLHVKNNVAFNNAGHNIFLEDGIETNNLIEYNLILGTIQVWSMLQSDITPGSYWITNPLNYVSNNRAAGGDFYGFWYEIKEHPDGPSARNDICPQGMGLGLFTNNVAHSYDRFGLRIFVMTNLQYPCNPYRDDTQPNPFVNNTSFTITWSNFVAYRNNEDGVLAEEVGNMIFNNFTLVGNKQSGFNSYLTNRTDEYVILQNSLIVGQSVGNPADVSDLQSSYGLITPRTDGFKVQSVHFANFIQNMKVFKSCSFCWHFKKWVQGGKLTLFSQITYESISTNNYMYWDNWRREIYQDLDGSLSGKGSQQWITPAGPHLVNQKSCQTSSQDMIKWNNAVICSQQVVRIEFSNPVDSNNFRSKALYVLPCDSTGKGYGGTSNTDYYISKSVKIENAAGDLTLGFVGTFLTGQIFQVQWEMSQIDFTHFSIGLSPYHTGTSASDTILIKFPINDFRETWQNFQMIAGVNVQLYKNITSGQDPTALANLKTLNCNHGDWFNDIVGQALWLCLNAKNRPKATNLQYLERVDLNALSCLANCPLPPGQCKKDGVLRRISNLATWQGVSIDGNPGPTINSSGNSTLWIPCPWEVVVDQDLTKYTQIIVEGNLRIDPTKNVNIQANGIWLKGGLFIAEGSTPGSPYTYNLNIQLNGNQDQPTQFVIDPLVDVGNKVILNTGNFTLIGNPPSTTYTQLAASANPGDSSITVVSVNGWSVEDIIAVAPTQLDATENEIFSIQQINGNVVTLNSTIQFYHYGAQSITLQETWGSYSQQLDLRAQVLHLNRNIKIVGSPVSTGIPWGCRVLSHYWQILADASGNPLPPEKQLHLRGILTWNGVEMRNCGQADTSRGGIDFRNCTSDANNQIISNVINSSFHDCPGYCANIDTSSNINISNNNFFRGKPIFLGLNYPKNVTISKNIFVAALKRDYQYSVAGMLYDMNTAIYFLSTQDPTADSILISQNIVQGSQGPCLSLVQTPCSSVSKISSNLGVWGNQAQTCLVGVLFKQTLNGCQWAGKIAVARSVKGIMVNPTQPSLIVEHVLAAESNRSVILRFAHQGYRNVGVFQNSSIFGVAITNDPTAYDSSTKAQVCQGGSGTQNLVVTEGGEDFPLKTMPLSFDVICNSEVFDASLYQVNVKYVNFKKTYNDANFKSCANNFMMVTHPSASDHTAGTYNQNVTCVNCSTEAYFNFMSPNPAWAGWFGGCGLFLCTGPDNVLNVDFTGSLFNNIPSSGISHNKGIANKNCISQPNWNNAYQCPGTNYAQLEWQSESPDHNKRSTAPCQLTSLDGSYTNKINMFREWQWDGNEPMNLRENRYYATVLLNTTYNIQYNGLNPYNIIHRIQQRTNDNIGEPNAWVIFNSQYSVPQNIEVSIDGGAVVEPFLVSDNVDLTKNTTCGANIYNYETRTISFVINGAANCLVRVQILDTVRIQIKVSISNEEFFKNNNKFSFISAIASFLGIQDFSRIKVVGAATGSRFLQSGSIIQSQKTSSSSSQGFNLAIDITNKSSGGSINPDTVHQDLMNKANQLQAGFANNNIPGIKANTFTVVSTQVMVSSDSNGGIYGQNSSNNNPTIQESSQNSSNNTLAIILGVVLGFLAILIVIAGFIAYKKYKKSKIIQNKNNVEGEKLVEIDSIKSEPQKENVKENLDNQLQPINLDSANNYAQTMNLDPIIPADQEIHQIPLQGIVNQSPFLK